MISLLDKMFNISSTEFVVIGLILIVFLGAKRLAGLGKGAGEAMREVKKVKKELRDVTDELTEIDVSQETDKKKRGVAK